MVLRQSEVRALTRITRWLTHRCAQRPAPVSRLRKREARARVRRARYLVLLRAAAVHSLGMAVKGREDAERARVLLPDLAAHHRAGHPLLLGGPHDHDG